MSHTHTRARTPFGLKDSRVLGPGLALQVATSPLLGSTHSRNDPGRGEHRRAHLALAWGCTQPVEYQLPLPTARR